MRSHLKVTLGVLILGLSTTSSFAEEFPSFGISMLEVQATGPYPVLDVTSDGQTYDKASEDELTFHIQGKGRCQNLHWLSKISMNIQKINPNNNPSEYKSLSILDHQVNKKTWSNEWLTHALKWSPHSSIRNGAVAACNVELEKRVQQGGDRSSILKDGFQTTLTNKAENQLNLACGGPSGNSGHPRHVNSAHKVIVNCAKYVAPLAPIKATKVPVFSLKTADITMPVTNYQGTCPTTLAAKAIVTTNSVKGSFQYRFLEEGKAISGWQNKTLDEAVSQVNLTHMIKVEAPKAQPPAAKGFQSQGQGNAQMNPQLQQAPTRHVSIEVKSAGQQMSDVQEYSVTCKALKTAQFVGKSASADLALPDLTSRKGITIGSQSSAWGGMIKLAKKDAMSVDARGCRYRFLYDVVNIGQANSGPATNTLRRNGTVLHSANGFAVAKNQSRNVSGHITLPPGNYSLTAFIDNAENIAELKETNNQFNINLQVDKDCGGSGTPARAVPRIQ